MARVLISAPYMVRERATVEPLLPKQGVEVIWADVRERLEEEELIPLMERVDGVICGDDRFTSQVFERAACLRVVVKWGTGIDSIDKQAAEKKGIRVLRTPGAFTEPVADSTLGYILAHFRNMLGNDAVLKSGGWYKPPGFALFERTVGLIGLGDIGSAVAKRLAAFGTKIVGYDCRIKHPELVTRYGIRLVSLDELLRESDCISLHCDLNPTSRQILNRAAFATMTRRPYIINTARGPLIEESALIDALVAGQVSGAALDVFEKEPLPKNSPLRHMNHVLLASHNANSSPTCWQHVHRNSVQMLLEGLGIG